MSFAVTLHYYSPRAYEYVVSFITQPAVSTICRKTSEIECEPGFISCSLESLANELRSNPAMRDCAVIFDGMTIQKEAVVDPKTRKTVGFVDYGFENCHPDIFASEALVAMVSGIRFRYKRPIGYFLNDKVPAVIQAEMFKEAIIQLSERGFTVHCITCDGTHTNRLTGELLGCTFVPPDNIKPYFPHPLHVGQVVHFIFDPPHLMKNIRNYLGEGNIFYDESGNSVSWKFIVDLMLIIILKQSLRHRMASCVSC